VNLVLTNGEHIKAKDTDEDVISFDVVLGISHKPNIDLYVTGSNSKMLSTDIITEFRDKATNISIYPLSFEEYYN
jgi:predicted AAA+ superfamily ATPase